MRKFHVPIWLVRVVWWLIAIPVALFLLATVLLYVPAVQDFAVRHTAVALSKATGYDVHVGRVRLTFPLSLSADSVSVLEQGDTLLQAAVLRMRVEVLPLFRAQANVNDVTLSDAWVDTKSLIGGSHVRGYIGSLRLETRGIGWETERVRLHHALLDDADLVVCLSDTALTDTVATDSRWVIDVYGARLRNVKARVALPPTLPDTEDGDTLQAEQMWIYAELPRAELRNGHFDTGKGDYACQGVDLSKARVVYRQTAPAGTWIRRTSLPPLPADKAPTAENHRRNAWGYADNMEALRAWNPVEEPSGGVLDPSNVVLEDFSARVEGFSYGGDGRMKLRLAKASLREKNSGMAIDNLSGDVYMDNERIRLPEVTLRTGSTTLRLGGDVPWDALTNGRDNLMVHVDAVLGWQDVQRLGRGYVDPVLLDKYPHLPLTVKGQVGGNMQHLRFRDLFFHMPDVITAKATGQIDYFQTRPQGSMSFTATTGAQFPILYRTMLPDMAQSVTLPEQMTAKGSVGFRENAYRMNTELGTGGGTAWIQGYVNAATENFDLDLKARDFPIKSFLAGLDATAFTGNAHLVGNSFDPTRHGAHLQTTADVRQFGYGGYNLSGIQLDGTIQGGKATARFHADNPNLEGAGTLYADLAQDGYKGQLDADVRRLDMQGLGLVSDTLMAGGKIRSSFTADKAFQRLHADASVQHIRLTVPHKEFATEDLSFSFTAAGDSTYVRVESGDLVLRAGAKGSLEHLSDRLGKLMAEMKKQFERKELDQEALKRELPPMDVFLSAGPNNPVSSSLRYGGYAFRKIYADLHAHPSTGLNGTARVGGLTMGKILLDTVHLNVLQDTTGLQLDGFVKNYTKKNPNKFEACLHGYLLAKGAGLEAQFYDYEGEKGIDLGVKADFMENGISLSLSPRHPVLAYRTFTINKDNYLFLGDNKQIRTNIDLLADDGTRLQLYSTNTESDSVNDITASLTNIHLAELSNVLPYLPKMDGILNGDFHIQDNHVDVSAMASLEAKDFSYDGTRLGTLGAEVIYLPKSETEHYASAYISSNGKEVMEAKGTYYTSDDVFDGVAHLHDFPLAMANAFLEGSDLALRGQAGGDLTVKGTLSKPVVNGELQLDSAYIYSDVYGFRFKMDEAPVVFNNSRIRFNDYQLRSTGSEPLVVNGMVDMTDLSRMTLDLSMKAKNFELINTRRRRKSVVFGKVFTDFMGTVKGSLDNLSVRGKLDVLDKTDVTYILKDSPLSTENRLEELVTFTSFTDSIEEVKPVEVASMNLDLALGINVSDAANFHCYLSEDGKSYANINGGGALTLRLTSQGDMRLTGKLTAQGGDMKYELPVIPLRTFNLREGSTVEFTGDPVNPTLNIHATERMKVLVTEDERQRTVSFDVGVAITKPLDQMGLEFTIEAPEDLSIQNQLAAMSPEQRNKAAVAMMATGMYFTDGGAQTSGFKANNALNAFLQNEIQNIAGKALKTIDVSLGVETGTSLAGTQTTDYSFQFAKRFWDDRVRVIIGGRVSAGKNADNRAESIINNVAVEYRMNKGATRYLRVFYDRDQQDPLEGQLTNTGVGYSVRRKADRFIDLFLFRPRKKHEVSADSVHQKR